MNPKKTALHAEHVRLGARLVDFAGWEMPVQYAGPLEEHRAVRNACGIFDVSHMGNVLVSGARVGAALDRLTTWPMSKLPAGSARYTVFLNDRGGTVDDLIVYRRSEHEYLIIWNASNHTKNLAWTRPVFDQAGVTLRDLTMDYALIAVQGPAWQTAFNAAFPDLQAPGGRFKFCERTDGERLTIVARTGYTGEDGVEVLLPDDRAIPAWRALCAHATPCGLAARDSLRIEAGLPLYGHELDEDTDPVEAGVGFVLRRDGVSDFIGATGLAARLRGPRRECVGFRLTERGVPRQGYPVIAGDGRVVGRVSSGSYSPVIDAGIGLALVDAHENLYHASNGCGWIEIRGKRAAIRFAKPPIHKA